ncbi:TPA: recombinase family protein [Aeromonas veronii]
MRKIGYARVSTGEQNTARQWAAFEPLNLDHIYEDKATGANTDRPALQELLAAVEEGDHVYVYSIDRLARNTVDLLTMTESLHDQGVALTIVDRSLTISADPIGKMILTMIAAVGELERGLIRERCRAGIEVAKAKGNVYKGRPRNAEQEAIAHTIEQLLIEGLHWTAINEQTGASRALIYRIKKALSTEQTGL